MFVVNDVILSISSRTNCPSIWNNIHYSPQTLQKTARLQGRDPFTVLQVNTQDLCIHKSTPTSVVIGVSRVPVLLTVSS